MIPKDGFLPIGKSKDLTGQKFGRLTAIGIVEKRSPATGNPKAVRAYWLCQCECGEYVTARGSHLSEGSPFDCGKHSVRGEAKEPKLIETWKAMKQRCENPKCKSWVDYGGRGISVCEEWQSYQAFEAWALSNGYQEGLTIDRVDVNGHYSPDNCRWATRKMQQQNRRVNRYITAWGETKCLEEWGRDKRANAPATTIRARILKGIAPELAIASPNQQLRLLTAWGETKCIQEWARDARVTVSVSGITYRISRGMKPEDALRLKRIGKGEISTYR